MPSGQSLRTFSICFQPESHSGLGLCCFSPRPATTRRPGDWSQCRILVALFTALLKIALAVARGPPDLPGSHKSRQHRILRGAGENGPCGREIASRLTTVEPDITRLLYRMEKRGLISQRRDAKDHRVVNPLPSLSRPAHFNSRMVGDSRHLGFVPAALPLDTPSYNEGRDWLPRPAWRSSSYEGSGLAKVLFTDRTQFPLRRASRQPTPGPEFR